MKATRGRLGWWLMAGLCSASACGQELALPQRDSAAKPVAAAAADGTTGAGGAPSERPAQPRLPISDRPFFPAFGGGGADDGDGGDTGDEAQGGSGAASGSAGQAGSVGTSGAQGGGGGRPAVAGAGNTSGAGGAGGAGALAAEAGSGGGGEPAFGEPPALWFSEYVEGSGSLKALEIYAAAVASLEGCELQTYFNGKLEPSRLALHGTLARGAVQVLCSTALASAQPTLCDRSTSLTFNGDDALALSCGGALLDVIGQIGVDPGDAWGAGATADHTLRRRCSVSAGRSDGSQPFDPDPEWLVFGADTFSDLGVHDCSL